MALVFNPQISGMPGGLPAILPEQLPKLPAPNPMPTGTMTPAPGFFARIGQALQDPNVKQAIAATGIGLMRSPQFGQNGFDVASDALGLGMNTLAGLRERDRKRAIEDQDRKTKDEQRQIENKRADRQVVVQETNAQTSKTNVEGDQAAKKIELDRAERALAEAIRHNKSQEEIDRLRAMADNIRATAYYGTTSRTPAEIQKINRLKAFYKQQNPGMTDEEADKQAMDYLSTAKGKSPRQLVMDAFQKKVAAWQESQFDPTAMPTPEMREQWKQQAIAEVKFAEEAGQEVTQTRGVITRPGGASPPSPSSATPSSGARAPGVSPAASAQPPSAPNPATQRSIEIWKVNNATPAQIKQLIAAGGEDPAIYGY